MLSASRLLIVKIIVEGFFFGRPGTSTCNCKPTGTIRVGVELVCLESASVIAFVGRIVASGQLCLVSIWPRSELPI